LDQQGLGHAISALELDSALILDTATRRAFLFGLETLGEGCLAATPRRATVYGVIVLLTNCFFGFGHLGEGGGSNECPQGPPLENRLAP
jgi:hypothetical protein